MIALALSALLSAAPCTHLTGARCYLAAEPFGRFAPCDVLIAPHEPLTVSESPLADARDCVREDARGRWLTPGFIESFTQLGLTEIDGEPATANALPGLGINAAFAAADGFNPLSAAIGVSVAGGITTAVVTPHGGLVSGRAAAVRLVGRLQSDAVFAPFAGLAVDLRAVQGPHPGALHRLEAALLEGVWFRAHREAWERGASRPLTLGATDLEALAAAATGEQLLLAQIDRAADIEALLRLRGLPSRGAADGGPSPTAPALGGAGRLPGLRMVLVGAPEAWLVAESLALAKVPVIVDALLNGPATLESQNAREDHAAVLVRAGVPVILSSFSNHNARTLRHVAGNAVRAGLTPEQALHAITRAPAHAFGLGRRGELSSGAVADVVLWDGDPLEVSSAAVAVFIDGEPVTLTNRQTLLRDRYRPRE